MNNDTSVIKKPVRIGKKACFMNQLTVDVLKDATGREIPLAKILSALNRDDGRAAVADRLPAESGIYEVSTTGTSDGQGTRFEYTTDDRYDAVAKEFDDVYAWRMKTSSPAPRPTDEAATPKQ